MEENTLKASAEEMEMFHDLFSGAEELINEINDEDYIQHYGMPRRSGRYPWGSGDNPYQHSGDFLARKNELKKSGMSEKEIADYFNMSTTQYRAAVSIANAERRSYQVETAKSLKAHGYNNVEIAKKMGLPGESSVRSLLNSDSESRMKKAESTASNLKKLVDERGMIDVGIGAERQLGISKEKMNQALEMLKMEGYEVYGNRVPQATNPGKYTTLKVLCPPGTKHSEIYDYDKINYINDLTSRDGGDTFEPTFVYPKSLDSNRLAIRYAEDGGVNKDGVMEIRRGVKDLSLGESNYSQVRILVDGKRYLKGMAVYSDDLPDGVDIVFNTNKGKNKSKMEVLKEIKEDSENPFGSSVRSTYYIDENGERQLSLINKRSDEGEWGNWSDHLPSQFLAKQSLSLIKKQLNLTASDKEDEYDEICRLTNPTIKRNMLETFADDCDSAAVHLQAAALPGQKYQVILPLTSVKDTEVYAPNFKDGTQVALVRYPHGGTFEIPILKVNNKLEEGKKMMGTNPADAIGINKNVADRLSGADFDGDTVMVIPLSDKVKITSTKQLKELEGFDTKLAYQYDDKVKDANGKEHYYRAGKEIKIMNNTQTEMGKISNLITDMTLRGASTEELARAVKHSMVVIDAEKHKLDYKQSEIDNNIDQLKRDYQGREDSTRYGGASTLISKAKSPIIINERKDGAFFTKEGNHPASVVDEDKKIYVDDITGEILKRNQLKPVVYVNPETGEKMYHDTNRTFRQAVYKDSNGKTRKSTVITKDGKDYFKDEDGQYTQVTNEIIKVRKATQESTKMAETSNARTLSSGTPQEEAYAEYANKMKALANRARKEALVTKDIPYSPAAKEAYSEEVKTLNAKLNIAELNAPKERQAQTIANTAIRAQTQANPKMTSEEKKKLSQREIAKARIKVGAGKKNIEITQKEWAAIQAGAISKSRLQNIINNCDTKTLRQLATPRDKVSVSSSKIGRIKSMANCGYTNAEIAEALGLSASTVVKYINGKE